VQLHSPLPLADLGRNPEGSLNKPCTPNAFDTGEDWPWNTIVHHQPLTGGLSWNMHVWEAAWDGNQVWDVPATLGGTTVISNCPTYADVRALQFKVQLHQFRDGTDRVEADDFIRRAFLAAPNEIWTFIRRSGAYTNPSPAGAIFMRVNV